MSDDKRFVEEALSEKNFRKFAKSRTVSPEKTKICCTRYGNVMCSRGSMIPLWIEQITHVPL